MSVLYFSQANTARVIFSWGVLDPVTLLPQYHGTTNRGAVSLDLLGGLVNKPTLPADARNLTLTIKNVSMHACRHTFTYRADLIRCYYLLSGNNTSSVDNILVRRLQASRRIQPKTLHCRGISYTCSLKKFQKFAWYSLA